MVVALEPVEEAAVSFGQRRAVGVALLNQGRWYVVPAFAHALGHALLANGYRLQAHVPEFELVARLFQRVEQRVVTFAGRVGFDDKGNSLVNPSLQLLAQRGFYFGYAQALLVEAVPIQARYCQRFVLVK